MDERRGHHARVPRALRDRIPKHRLHLVYLARLERTHHGRVRDHDVVRPFDIVPRALLCSCRSSFPSPTQCAQAHVHGHLGSGHALSLRHQYRVLARILWYVLPFFSPPLTVIDDAHPTRRSHVRGVRAFRMEGGSHRGDQRASAVRHQVDTQSGRAGRIEQVALASRVDSCLIFSLYFT